jgi:hypothetical protein
MVTHQPAYKTYSLTKFSFGAIHFKDDSENSNVQLLINTMDEKKIIGLMIRIDDDPEEAQKMKQYLDEKYGTPKMITPEPTKKFGDVILGIATYQWLDKQSNCSIYFYRSYYEQNYKQAMSYSMHVIHNDAMSIENPESKIIDRYNTRF